MKNTVRVLIFVIILAGAIFLFRENLELGLFRIFSLLITFSVFFIGLVIFLENRHPTQTITWLVVLGSFPLLGFIFYILFGRNYKKERIFRKKYFLDKQTFLHIEGDNSSLPRKYEGQQKLVTLAQRLGNSPISFSTETKTLTNGSETFEHILLELKKAKHHIHLEYYIVRDDKIGREIKTILANKAREGVQVRFLYDAVGSWQLSKKYISDLKKAGVEAVPFGPVKLPFLNNKFNFRNHRKIIVIDGTTGFVGGLNIGDEYLGRVKRIGFWRDTHLMLKGEAVRSLQLIFLQDWYYMTNTSLLTDEYLKQPNQGRYHGGVQLIAGGPDNEWTAIKNIFFSMITSAEKSVWIASPYFIPDEDIFSAIKVAALSGIDVRLLVPDKPDKRIVFHASRSYFPDLLEAGVKIYEYQQGFMHSKIVIVDGELASIGTSNMDMRSFHLNFEVNAFLYRTESTRKLVKEYMNDLKHANKLELESFQKRHIGYRLLESTSRLMSPLL
ncbi:cardiolipin synthase [Bacillus sp. FJAT-27445]|uniref:cardiolipin synthase n=1 Tax=Bacillus sp. FJAT-27445 TaxID=1679166 RepID=UPI000743742A|nr:cardiolipin synthase [Bacillus sp. FJAT-27445]